MPTRKSKALTHMARGAIEVVTAIESVDDEEFVAQTFHEQGWRVAFRALNGAELLRYLDQGLDYRTVVLFTENFPGLSPHRFEEYADEYSDGSLLFLSVDELLGSESLLVSRVSRAVRNQSNQRTDNFNEASPHVRAGDGAYEKTYIKSSNKVITVVGTSGAPGRTSFVLSAGRYLAVSEGVCLVDADLRSQNLERLARNQKIHDANLVTMAPLDLRLHPTELPHDPKRRTSTLIVDLGVLPSADELTHDRRWQGALQNDILDRTTHLVFVAKSTQPSMEELGDFLRNFPSLVKSIPITFLCVLVGHSRELREWEAKFLALTLGENRHVIRESEIRLGNESSLVPFLKSPAVSGKGIARIVSSMV